ncbi:hypothetical protein ACLB1G_06260 [Oxalobacteraceae bacterium A2-2]
MDAKIQRAEARFDARFAAILQTGVQIQADIRNLKITTIITAISSILAVATFNATLLSGMVASLESGRNMTQAQAEVKRQIAETDALLKRVREDAERARDADRDSKQ